MAEISKITLPDKNIYNLKDATARSSISTITSSSITNSKSVATYITDLTHTASIPVSAGTTVKITAIVDCESETIASSLVTGVAGNTTYQSLGLLYNGSTVVAKVSDFGFSQSGRLIIGTYSYTNSSKSAVTLTDRSKSYNDTLYTLFKSVCSKDHFIVTSLTYAVEVLETTKTDKIANVGTPINAIEKKVAEHEALLKGYVDRVNTLELKNYAAFGPVVMPLFDTYLPKSDETKIAYTYGGTPDDATMTVSDNITLAKCLDKQGNEYDSDHDTFAVTGFISSPNENYDYFVRFHSTSGGNSNAPDRMQEGVNLAVYDKNKNFLWGCPIAMPDWIAFIPRDCKVRVAFGRASDYGPTADIYTGTKIDSGTNKVNANFTHAEGAVNSANSVYDHVEGYANTTSGGSCHAEGQGNTASGGASHVEGYHNTVSNFAAHAEGTYNVSTRDTTNKIYTKHSIGVGTPSTRRNAFEITTDSDDVGTAPTKVKAYIYGVGSYNGTNVTSSSVKDLATVINENASNISTLKTSITTTQTKAQAATDAANRNSLSIVFKYNGYAVDVLDYDTVKMATKTPTFEADFYQAGADYNAAKAVMTSYDVDGNVLGSAIKVTDASSVVSDGGSLYLSKGCAAIEVKIYATSTDTKPAFTRSCTMIKYASAIVSLTNSVADLQSRVEELESKVSE